MTERAILLGARSFVAPHLKRRLDACFQETEALGRDLRAWAAPSGAVIFSLIPLPALPALLPRVAEAKQIIALSSTSAVTKATSPDPRERALAAALLAAETALAQFCRERGILWTVLRPTLIYDPGVDRNVSAIAAFIRRFGFFPIVHPGRGLRQPVHADDVAAAMIAAIDNTRALGKIFDLPGADTLSYREMVARIFAGLGRAPRILPCPASLLRFGLTLVHRIFRRGYSPALLDRMNQDLAFDRHPAEAALDYRPRPFHPGF
ncbi:MAG TPA: NAD-dependent epimerase/dehydratase family protein [Stellaceae bacterium]|nr:NAD-dependent epimerase/dehydratase family protein [Stellaceae bacterium]